MKQEEHVLGDLILRTVSTPEAITVHWLGKSDSSTPEANIVPILLAAADAAQGSSLPLTFAFEKLDYFNSATITVLIRTIRSMRGRKVALTLRYDDLQRWQRTFFDAFTGVGLCESDDVRVEAVRR